jgi:hypothetical protein
MDDRQQQQGAAATLPCCVAGFRGVRPMAVAKETAQAITQGAVDNEHAQAQPHPQAGSGQQAAA